MTISHLDVIAELEEHFRPIFENSPDGVYLWLDEEHKVCNEHLANMFGCTVAEWCAKRPFLQSFVAEDDRSIYSWNYQNRVATLSFPVTFRFRGLRKDGSTFAAETDMTPITFRGHTLAYHFVRQIAQ